MFAVCADTVQKVGAELLLSQKIQQGMITPSLRRAAGRALLFFAPIIARGRHFASGFYKLSGRWEGRSPAGRALPDGIPGLIITVEKNINQFYLRWLFIEGAARYNGRIKKTARTRSTKVQKG